MSGPLVQKTFTEDWQNAFAGWLCIPLSSYGTCSYDPAEGALKLDANPGGGFLITSRIMLHKGYPATFSCDMKMASSNPSYYSGIIMYAASQDYASAIACKNFSGFGVGSTPNVLMAANEMKTVYVAGEALDGTGPGNIINGTSSWPTTSDGVGELSTDVYHHYELIWDGSGTVTISVDNVALDSISQQFLTNIMLSLISVSATAGDHTACWFKNVQATGVFVTDISGQVPVGYTVSGGTMTGGFNLADCTLQSSPVLNNETGDIFMGGVELIYSSGYHDYTSDSTGAVDKQTGGTFALSGHALTLPFPPPGISGWDKVWWRAALASGTISIQVCDADGTLLSDSIVTGNSGKLALSTSTGSIDLSGVNAGTYPTLTFRVWMTSSTSVSSPILYSLFTTFATSSDMLSYTVPADASSIRFSAQPSVQSVTTDGGVIAYGTTETQQVEAAETDLSAAATVADVVAMLEYAVSAASATTATNDTAQRAEALLSVVQAAPSVADAVAAVENLVTSVTGQATASDTFVSAGGNAENLQSTAEAVVTLADLVQLFDQLTIAIQATATVADAISMLERAEADITAQATIADLQFHGVSENLASAADVVISAADAQLMVDNLTIMAQSGATIADIAAYLEQVTTSATGGASVTDALMGAFVGQYIFRERAIPRGYSEAAALRTYKETARAH
jgi:hypothetical protein